MILKKTMVRKKNSKLFFYCFAMGIRGADEGRDAGSGVSNPSPSMPLAAAREVIGSVRVGGGPPTLVSPAKAAAAAAFRLAASLAGVPVLVVGMVPRPALPVGGAEVRIIPGRPAPPSMPRAGIIAVELVGGGGRAGRG